MYWFNQAKSWRRVEILLQWCYLKKLWELFCDKTLFGQLDLFDFLMDFKQANKSSLLEFLLNLAPKNGSKNWLKKSVLFWALGQLSWKAAISEHNLEPIIIVPMIIISVKFKAVQVTRIPHGVCQCFSSVFTKLCQKSKELSQTLFATVTFCISLRKDANPCQAKWNLILRKSADFQNF